MTLLPLLTSDNLQLSRPTNDGVDPMNALKCTTAEPDPRLAVGMARSAVTLNCTNLEARVAELVRASLAPNTRHAYAADVAAFQRWGGTLPATPEMVAAYLADHADVLSIATLTRRLAALSRAHDAGGHPNSVRSELVRAVMRGIRRTRPRPPIAAHALRRDQLATVFNALGDGLRDSRDRALLLLGFAAAFRRSELAGLHLSDLRRTTSGLVIKLHRSKTDPFAAGRNVIVTVIDGLPCPVAALDQWLAAAKISQGPIFRPVSRHGRVAPQPLRGEAVAIMLRQRLAAVGIDPTGYAGHSLRAGYVTDAAERGVPTWRIRRQTGHASDEMLARYIRVTSPEANR